MKETIQAHQKALCTKLWAMANALRGNMEAYEFKNYILGMIFYYYLSDRTEKYMAKNLKHDGKTYEEAVGGRWKMDAPIPEAVAKMPVYDAADVEKGFFSLRLHILCG